MEHCTILNTDSECLHSIMMCYFRKFLAHLYLPELFMLLGPEFPLKDFKNL